MSHLNLASIIHTIVSNTTSITLMDIVSGHSVLKKSSFRSEDITKETNKRKMHFA